MTKITERNELDSLLTVDKALIEQAIDVINSECGYGGSNAYEPRAIAEALRTALARPAVEPVIDDSTVLAACRKLKPTLFTQGLKPLETDGENWRKNMREVEATVRTVLSFVNAPPLPPAEPRISTEHCSLAERQSHQASVNYPSDDMYCPRCQCSERFLQSRQCEPHIVYDAPPTPADVPLLDDMSILRMWHKTSSRVPMCNHYNHFARAIEQAVRQKAGLK